MKLGEKRTSVQRIEKGPPGRRGRNKVKHLPLHQTESSQSTFGLSKDLLVWTGGGGGRSLAEGRGMEGVVLGELVSIGN